MTPPKKQPQNSELLKEIKDVQATLRDHNARLSAVEYWRVSQDAGKAAVDEYRRQEQRNPEGGTLINKELLKALGLALTALVSLAAFIQASK